MRKVLTDWTRNTWTVQDMWRPFPQGKSDSFPNVAVYPKRRCFQASVSAHLVLSDDPHASTAAPVCSLEDDGEAVGLGKHLCLLHAGDGRIRSGDDRHT